MIAYSRECDKVWVGNAREERDKSGIYRPTEIGQTDDGKVGYKDEKNDARRKELTGD